jgi:hypothetical protein
MSGDSRGLSTESVSEALLLTADRKAATSNSSRVLCISHIFLKEKQKNVKVSKAE